MARNLTKYVIEYYKAYGRPPGFEFKENPSAKLDKDEPKEVIDNLKQREKKLVTTKKWDDIDSEAHDKAFTVANIMKADILQEIYNEVEKAAKNGKPFKDFMNSVIDGGLKDRMIQAGWTGGDNPSRLKVIWDTNINMAYAKEEYKAMKLVADEKPYWIYHQIERANKNKDHTQWNGRKFKHDDPIWNYIYPPSKFGCACWVEATDDPTGCESSKSLNLDAIHKNAQISPLKAWQPDTTKYVDGIREQLQQMIDSKDTREDNNDNPLIRVRNVETELDYNYNEEIQEYNLDYNAMDNLATQIRNDRSEHYSNLPEPTRTALYSYIGAGYKAINDDLRKGIKNAYYDAINDGDINYQLQKGVTLFRGERYMNQASIENRLSSILNGTGFKTLLSTSAHVSIAEQFSEIKNVGQSLSSILYIIKNTTRKNVGLGTDYEYEIIFNKDIDYKIISINRINIMQGGSAIIIELEI